MTARRQDGQSNNTSRCIEKFSNFTYQAGKTYCNSTYDGYLCWSPTPGGEVASQNCPPTRFSDTTKIAYRKCGTDGMWMGKHPNETTQTGWTNYTPCFPPLVQNLLNKVYDHSEGQRKFEIAQTTRYMEIAGFSISLVALMISLWIFYRYRSLRNHRTRIHNCLFGTMVVQVMIRLTVYIDQALVRTQAGEQSEYDNVTMRGIDNMSYLCECSYVLLEYTITCMFMWMFIEGLYLHNVVTGNALRERVSYWVYYVMGWGLPIIVTAIWTALTAVHYQDEEVDRCWYGYNFSSLFWIVQGPRLAVIMVNLVFLLNIMRVLIVKLRQSTTTEMEKMRKAVRAALVLLPLLGITNALNMTEAPLDGSVWEFAAWSYSCHFLRSFQGFFIALIYCFLNAEVRQVIRTHYENYKAIRTYRRRQRDSYRDSGIEMRPIPRRQITEPRHPKLRMKWTRPVSTNPNISETEFGSGIIQENRSRAVRFTEAPTISATIHVESEDFSKQSQGSPRHHAVIVHHRMPRTPSPKPPKSDLYD